jgi:hypothetical protein
MHNTAVFQLEQNQMMLAFLVMPLWFC